MNFDESQALCAGTGNKDSLSDFLFSDIESDVPQLKETPKDSLDTSDDDGDDSDDDRKMPARKDLASPTDTSRALLLHRAADTREMVASEDGESSMLTKRVGRKSPENAAGFPAISSSSTTSSRNDEEESQSTTEKEQANKKPSSNIRRSLRARNETTFLLQEQKLEEPKKKKIKRKRTFEYSNVKKVMSARLDEKGSLEAKILWKKALLPQENPQWVKEADLEKNIVEQALALVPADHQTEDRGTFVAGPAKMTRQRSKPKEIPKKKQKRKTKKQLTEEKYAGQEGFLGASTTGEAQWDVKEIVDRKEEKKGNVSGYLYKCRWQGNWDDTWEPLECLGPRARREAFQKYPENEESTGDEMEASPTPGNTARVLPTQIAEDRRLPSSQEVSETEYYSETENMDYDEDSDDIEDLGGMNEIRTADNKLLRKDMLFYAEKDCSILAIRTLLVKEEVAICERLIPSWDTFLSGTEAEQPEFFPVGALTRAPFSQLKKRCKPETITRSKWLYAIGKVPKHDFAFYREEKERKVPPSLPGKAKPKVLELFAGAGGMTVGFMNAGFDTKWAVENNKPAAATLRSAFDSKCVWGECVRDFISRSEKRFGGYPKKGEVDHIHASPPCQGYSRANRTGGCNDEENNSLSYEFVNAVRYFEPKTATFENVKGILHKDNVEDLKEIVADLYCMDYQVRVALLNSSDYGDPQKRERVIIWVAHTSMHLPAKPLPTHGKNLLSRRTVRDAIGCLERIDPYIGDNGTVEVNNEIVYDHCARTSKPTQEELEKNTLKPDMPACTIKGVNHPIHYNKQRFISVREAACLQSFPFDHPFSGATTDQFKQIGNAVPIMMATHIARSVAQVYGLP